MSVTLNKPLVSRKIDKAQIAAAKFETNPAHGQLWVEVWVTFGYEEGGVFHQMVHPETGAEAPVYVKIEDGMHPLVPSRLLSKCGTCGLWGNTRGRVECPLGCGGHMVAYDGWSRFMGSQTSAGTMIKETSRILYGFLLTEEVPHPDTGEMMKLLDASM